MKKYKLTTFYNTHPYNTFEEKLEEKGINIEEIPQNIIKVFEGEIKITIPLAKQIEKITEIPYSFWLKRFDK